MQTTADYLTYRNIHSVIGIVMHTFIVLSCTNFTPTSEICDRHCCLIHWPNRANSKVLTLGKHKANEYVYVYVYIYSKLPLLLDVCRRLLTCEEDEAHLLWWSSARNSCSKVRKWLFKKKKRGETKVRICRWDEKCEGRVSGKLSPLARTHVCARLPAAYRAVSTPGAG